MTDGSTKKNLTERQEALLAFLIREYTARPEPVSSKMLSLTSDLSLSSASIRNEMAVLEEKGYIRSPHTSSGRVPTEEGYRYFVQHLLNTPNLPRPEVEIIQARLQEAPLEMETWMQTATVILAQQTRSAALVTGPRVSNEQQFKHIQLISTHGRLILMVMVMGSGHVHQQMLVMSEPIPQNVLTQTSEMLNRVCVDQPASGVRDRSRALPTLLAREIGELAADTLQQMNEIGNRVLYRAGLSEVLPELEEEGARQALRILEGQTGLDEILDEMAGTRVGGVQVVVAGEGRWENLSNLSMVLGRYGTGSIMGAVGIVGPTRMPYGRAISTVGYIAQLMSDFLSQAHDETKPSEADDAEADRPNTSLG
jgi:heat-inducible transcriptional repressor